MSTLYDILMDYRCFICLFRWLIMIPLRTVRDLSWSQMMRRQPLLIVDGYPDERNNITIRKQNPLIGDPVWIPGYPGSGSEMLRVLVEEMTGSPAGSIFNHAKKKGTRCWTNQTSSAPTCKSHWPLGGPPPTRLLHSTAFLLIRNPRLSIPSYFNYIHERIHRIKDHSSQAPENDWRKWRTSSFNRQLQGWKKTVTWWHNESNPWDVKFLQYERLVDENLASSTLQQLGDELHQAGTTVTNEDFHTLWKRAVVQNAPVKRRRSYTPAFLLKEKQAMLKMFDEIEQESPPSQELSRILAEYRKDVQSNMPLET